MADSHRSIPRTFGYAMAAVTVAVVAPVFSRFGSRTTAWVRDTTNDVYSPWSAALIRFLGLDAQHHHHGETRDLLDELLGAVIGATSRRP